MTAAAVASMTGFARATGNTTGAATVVWELRSVNGKGLDVRLRLPPGWDSLEQAARDLISKRLTRGSVSGTLTVTESAQAAASVTLNQPLLQQLMEMAADLPPHIAPPAFDGLLHVRGVLVTAEEAVLDDEARAARDAAALAVLAEAVTALVAARAEEGRRLSGVLTAQLATIEDLVGRAAVSATARAAAAPDRLRAQIAELLGNGAPVSEDRLAQELALLAVRQDIREELDRLHAHVAQARELLASGVSSGRRLDFLCQEFNREANTLCSKAQDVDLTRIGLDLKAVIDQVREQVQNIE